MHCYRMLGSFADAEDALQDTLLSAWQGLGGFEGRASLRTWLYRIATNRCLSALRAATSGRPPNGTSPAWSRPSRPGWARSYGSSRIRTRCSTAQAGQPPGPEARYELAESVSLAFVTALQTLPPSQLAVLILRDVLGFHASEVAGLLDSHRRIGQQRAQTGPGGPAAATSSGRGRPAAARGGLAAPRTRSWPGSSAPTSRPTSTRWWAC